MYGGEENSGNGNHRNISNKDTLHISPHIAAHKSSGSSQSSSTSEIETCQEQENTTNSRLASIQSFVGSVPGCRVGIPTSTIFTEPFQHNVRTQSAHIQVPTIFTLPSSKALPQDLSAHANKLTTSENENVSDQKSLSHIHTVGGSSLENLAGSLFVPVSDRSSPTYFRLADGTTLSISSQHQAVLVSQNDNQPSSVHHSNIESVRQSHHGEHHSVPTSSVSTSMSMVSLPGAVSSQHHSSGGGLPEEHLYLVPPEIPSSSFLTAPEILPEREIIRGSAMGGVKEEDIGDHKDLVRQALQAAVVHNSQKTNSSQEVLEYNYGTEDIGGSDDCLVPEDIICHSTFCPQPNVKTQELLLMNINVNSGQQNPNKLGGVGSSMNEGSSGGQVVVLEQATSLDESGNMIPPIVISSRRRRTKLSEEAQAMRRDKIANRMREKRANETEKQKEARRMREAERMRRKRAQEDETSKERRRREAAERARLRRAKLSNEERELERKKAAARMRLRRQNENEEQKRLRRIKAAERMRRRRSVETPEERAARKLNIAMRMKVKRQNKEEQDPKEEKLDIDSCSLDSSALAMEEDKTLVSRQINPKENVIVPDSNGQYAPTGHIVVSSSSLPGVQGNLTLLQSDPPSNANSHMLQGAIISAVEVHHLSQPVTLQMRNVSPPPIMQRSPSSSSERPSMSHQKSVVMGQEVVSSHSQSSHIETRTTESLPKTLGSSHISTHHHLPHLLHHLTPHQDQHHHQTYILPHQSQHSHQQSQPLQLRHQ